jgi:hypothetical protein
MKSAFELISPPIPHSTQNCAKTVNSLPLSFSHAEMFEGAAFLHRKCILYTFNRRSTWRRSIYSVCTARVCLWKRKDLDRPLAHSTPRLGSPHFPQQVLYLGGLPFAAAHSLDTLAVQLSRDAAKRCNRTLGEWRPRYALPQRAGAPALSTSPACAANRLSGSAASRQARHRAP